MDFTANEVAILLDAARSVIVHTVRGDKSEPSTGDHLLDPSLLQPAGCFVTLHEFDSHRLRGCVGRIRADQPLLDAVREAARDVLQDPRFIDEPVRPADLPHLELEVSVLSAPRAIASVQEFEPLEHGIIVRVGGRTGLFLPQVARETGWSRSQLLARLCTEKLGLSADAWQDPDARLEIFDPRPAAAASVAGGDERFFG
jgi:AmmeMemoRadiSam system protein A